MSKADEARRALWLGRVEDWRRSGLSQSAYARRQGLICKQLNYWAHRLTVTDSAPALVPLRIQTDCHQPALQLLNANGWRLTLPADVSVAWLGELLRSLA